MPAVVSSVPVLVLVESMEGSRGVGAADGKLLGLIVGVFVVVVGKTEADGLIVGCRRLVETNRYYEYWVL